MEFSKASTMSRLFKCDMWKVCEDAYWGYHIALRAVASTLEAGEFCDAILHLLDIFDLRHGERAAECLQRLYTTLPVSDRLELLSGMCRALKIVSDKFMGSILELKANEGAILMIKLEKTRSLLYTFLLRVPKLGMERPLSPQPEVYEDLESKKSNIWKYTQDMLEKLMYAYPVRDLFAIFSNEQLQNSLKATYFDEQSRMLMDYGRIYTSFLSPKLEDCELWEDLWLKITGEGFFDELCRMDTCHYCNAFFSEEENFIILDGCNDVCCETCIDETLDESCEACDTPITFWISKNDCVELLIMMEKENNKKMGNEANWKLEQEANLPLKKYAHCNLEKEDNWKLEEKETWKLEEKENWTMEKEANWKVGKESGMGLVKNNEIGFLKHSELGIVNRSELGFVKSSELGIVNMSEMGIVNSSDLGIVNMSQLGIVNMSQLGITKRSELESAKPAEW